jgi:hypothetical protein
MKPRLIILSDLWGKEKSNWVAGYEDLLRDSFDIQFYDCIELAEISTVVFTEENLHNQFLNGGINSAVRNLLRNETGEVSILAFSIGGTIAWKAALKGLKISNLFAVSSTRLRYEVETPNCRIRLYYGEQDNYIPDVSWFRNFKIVPEINKNKSHFLYVEKDFIHLICNVIINQNA